MTNILRIRFIVAPSLVLGLCILFGIYTLWAYSKALSSSFVCIESVESKFPSPGNKIIAVVYTRNCGATTDFVTHVNLHTAGDAIIPDPDGVIHEGEVFLEVGQKNIGVQWTSEHDLALTAPGKSDLTTPDSLSWGDVSVRIKQ
jgi:hypothetical protein